MSTFQERYTALCKEKGIATQSKEIREFIGVSSGAISQWFSRQSIPKEEILSKLAQYFDVSVDYLLCLTDVRKAVADSDITEEEALLLDVFRSCSTEDRFRIIQLCMNIKDEKGLSEIAG